MIILITGASHTGKTLLAQRMLEKHRIPYLSIDHLKMGLIRSGNTELTPEDDDALTDYLWPIVREIMKTAIENSQDLIVEGCYVPFDWRKDLSERYLTQIWFICLAMTEGYVENHFDEIAGYESAIEVRAVDTDCTAESVKADNRAVIDGFRRAGEEIMLIEDSFGETMERILSQPPAAGESALIIRRFLSEDAEEVSDLIVRTLRTVSIRDYSAEYIEELITRMRPEDVRKRAVWTHFYVACLGGRIVGCGAIGPWWDRTDESGLFSFFVLPEYEGRGIGRRIMETLEADQFFLRAERVEIPASVTAVPFYLKMGYTYKNGVSEPDGEGLVRLEKRRIREEEI